MIETIIAERHWADALPAAPALAEECFKAASSNTPSLSGEIALLLTDDADMRRLNKQFRNRDAPTNVLSFPGAGSSIGDIALGLETCTREAAEKKISLYDHAAHLIVHGMLHLVGFDHQSDEEADAMERKEAEILESLNIANPYRDTIESRS